MGLLRRSLRLAGPAGLAVAAIVAAAGPVEARVLLTVEEALALAFPEARVERRTVFLEPAARQRIEARAGSALASAIVHPYVATREGETVGTAYFDVHLVRTLPETVMVVVAPDGTIERIEVLSFDEPPDYLPREGWYAQFEGEALDGELELGRTIRPVAGATLTARVTTEAARRVLALHEELAGPPVPASGETP